MMARWLITEVSMMARWLYYRGNHDGEVAVLPRCP